VSKGAKLSLSVRLHNVTEKLYCPGLTVNWGDGERSSREPDCDPFDEMTAKDLELVRLDTITHRFKRCPTGKVVFILTKADEVLYKGSVTYPIGGCH